MDVTINKYKLPIVAYNLVLQNLNPIVIGFSFYSREMIAKVYRSRIFLDSNKIMEAVVI